MMANFNIAFWCIGAVVGKWVDLLSWYLERLCVRMGNI